MKATALERQIRMLQVSRYTLNANYGQLIGAEEHYQDSPEDWTLGGDQLVREFQVEYLRRLHNYISSYYSLYEHTQAISNDISDKDLDKSYQQKKNELDIEEISTFLLRFRAYTQHCQLAPITVKLNYDPESKTEEYQLFVPREKLLEWDNWRTAEDFVKDLDEEIELVPLFEDIHELVNEFGDWFIAEVQRQKPEEVRDELIDELAELMHVEEPHSL